ncbi:velvet factor-domain-containing protein [Mycena galopus ATCC 62051]|nr:velvet factor-domain-containing protein [Mycena galopus ATCC 62051]
MSVSLTNPNLDHVPVPLFFPAQRILRKTTMDMDGSGGSVDMDASTLPVSYASERNRLQYELPIWQEPKQARMCGIGGKADRGPIDLPVIVQLRAVDSAASSSSSHPTSSEGPSSPSRENGPQDSAHFFLRNPYYFMFSLLAKPDDETELHWLKDGYTRCTTGSVVSSLYTLKDPTAPGASTNNGDAASPASDAGFFVFPDLFVRGAGSFRLKLSLFEVFGNDVPYCKSIYSVPFYVHTAKTFPSVYTRIFGGLVRSVGETRTWNSESSPLTCSLVDQGIKIRIRKDICMRQARHAAIGVDVGRPLPSGAGDDESGGGAGGGVGAGAAPEQWFLPAESCSTAGAVRTLRIWTRIQTRTRPGSMRWLCGLSYYRAGGACTGGGVSIRASLLAAVALPREAGVRAPSVGDAVALFIHTDWEGARVNGDESIRPIRGSSPRWARRATGGSSMVCSQVAVESEVGGGIGEGGRIVLLRDGQGCVSAGGQDVGVGAEAARCAPVCGSDWIGLATPHGVSG